MRSYFPILLAILLLAATFFHFAAEVRTRTHTVAEFDNDKRISKDLGIRCDGFRAQKLVGKTKSELDGLAALPNSILKRGGAGEVPTAEEAPEFEAELETQLGEKPGHSVHTQAYEVCGLNVVTVLYGEKIADAIYVPGEGKVFGVTL